MWQYAFDVLPEYSTSFPMILRERGENGWELCGFEYGCAWYKRPIKQSKADSSEEG